MRHVRVLPILGLKVVPPAGCGGEDRANGPEEAAAREGTQAFAREREVRASPDVAAGDRVETCDGGSIRPSAAEKRLLELHNEAREQRGLEPLCPQPTLTEAARARSDGMIEEDYFAHTAPDGETLGERLERFGYAPKGYCYRKVGGTIAWHGGAEPEPEEMFEGRMDSPGHRASVLDETIPQVGIGTRGARYEDHEESITCIADPGVRRR